MVYFQAEHRKKLVTFHSAKIPINCAFRGNMMEK